MTLTQARVHGRRLSPPCTWPRTALALSTSLRRRLGTRQRPMTESAECTVVVERLGIIYVLDTWTARPGPRRHSVVALNTLVIFMGMRAHAHLLFCMHIAHVYSHTRICIIRTHAYVSFAGSMARRSEGLTGQVILCFVTCCIIWLYSDAAHEALAGLMWRTCARNARVSAHATPCSRQVAVAVRRGRPRSPSPTLRT